MSISSTAESAPGLCVAARRELTKLVMVLKLLLTTGRKSRDSVGKLPPRKEGRQQLSQKSSASHLDRDHPRVNLQCRGGKGVGGGGKNWEGKCHAVAACAK